MTDTVDRLNQLVGDRYAVERQIGEGGMATVFLARDLRHDRRVALKLLRPDLGAVIGVERFLSEIKVTASLQHPNLLPLFDSGAADGTLFYVMPFVEGESLRHRLEREKHLSVEEAVRIIATVAGALDYAHRRGVIHRDLKPENILLQAGQPVVADFGIALAITNAGGARVTQTGLSLGTPQYMSPEQATGDRVLDGRTDIYALGALLYEMLTGDPPHTGSTAQAIIARILTEHPRPVRLGRPSVPSHVEAAVDRALQKLPADRFTTAEAFAEALTRPELTPAVGVQAAPPVGTRVPARRHVALVGSWALFALATVLAAPRLWRPEVAPDPVVRFMPDVRHLMLREDASPAISPDGTLLAFPGVDAARNIRLYVRALDRDEAVAINSETFEPNTPFFSPDGRSVGVVRGNKLWRVALAGGQATVICDFSGASSLATWGVNDEIVFGRMGNLYRVKATGGDPMLLVARDVSAGFTRLGAPHFLPKGDIVLAERVTASGPELIAVELASGRVTSLDIKGYAPFYVDGGWLVYVDAAGIAYTVPFDAANARVKGSPVRVSDGVLVSGHARLGVSRNGTIAYLAEAGGDFDSVFVTNRAGVRRGLPLPDGRYRLPRFSPDGGRLALVSLPRQSGDAGDVWTYEFSTRRPDRLASGEVSEWSGDGRSILYIGPSLARPRSELFHITPSGTSAGDTVVVNASTIESPDLSPDGRTIVYSSISGSFWQVFAGPVGEPEAARSLTLGVQPTLSPDGKWLAYTQSANSASPEGQVFVRRLSEPSGRWLVSTSTGRQPRWGSNGREIFYRDGDSVRVVAFDGAGDEPVIGISRALFADRYLSRSADVQYDVSRDGQQFVFVGAGTQRVALNVVLNRFDGLRQP